MVTYRANLIPTGSFHNHHNTLMGGQTPPLTQKDRYKSAFLKRLEKIEVTSDLAQADDIHHYSHVSANDVVEAFKDYNFMHKGWPIDRIQLLIRAAMSPQVDSLCHKMFHHGLVWSLPPIPMRKKSSFLLTKAGLALVDYAAHRHEKIAAIVDAFINKKARMNVDRNTSILYFGGCPDVLFEHMKLVDKYRDNIPKMEELQRINKIKYNMRMHGFNPTPDSVNAYILGAGGGSGAGIAPVYWANSPTINTVICSSTAASPTVTTSSEDDEIEISW